MDSAILPIVDLHEFAKPTRIIVVHRLGITKCLHKSTDTHTQHVLLQLIKIVTFSGRGPKKFGDADVMDRQTELLKQEAQLMLTTGATVS